MDQSQLADFITESFHKWENILRGYRIGDKQFYDQIQDSGDQYCINAYIKTEADVKVKFGGFLELEIFQKYGGKPDDTTVHSEMALYDSKTDKADLSLHQVKPSRIYLNRSDVLLSTRAVIEIKLVNFKQPRWGEEGLIKDILKFDRLDPLINDKFDIIKVFMVIDEGLRMNEEIWSRINTEAKIRNVLVLSNRS